MTTRTPWILLAFLLGTLPVGLLAQGPVITEIMAVNRATLPDEDGDFRDWIEISNPASTAVSLEGWFLSDNPANLEKWRFPAVAIPAGGRIVVFASEKNRADPLRELHTNFRLSSLGEFLALSDRDGQPVSGFAPGYPPQYEDISFGYPQGRSDRALLVEGAAARALVPTSSALEGSWASLALDDSGWLAGTTGVGYDVDPDYASLIGLDLLSAMRGVNPSAYVRVPFTVADPSGIDQLLLRLKYDDGFVAFLNGQEIVRRNAPTGTIPRWNWAATAEHGEPIAGSMGQDFDVAGTSYTLTAHSAAVPPAVRTGGPTGRYLQLLEDYTGNLTNTIGFARTFGPATNVRIDFDYRMSAEAGYTGNERADGFGVALLGTATYGTTGAVPAIPTVWERPAIADAFAVGFDIYNGSRTENTVSLNFHGLEVAATLVTAFPLNAGVFHHVTVEISSDESGSVVSVTMIPDTFGSPGAPLKVFDRVPIPGMTPFDHRLGFGGRTGGEYVGLDLDNIAVGYVHGTPEISFETFDVSARIPSLRAGTNVLAIQGLNVSAADTDFLILPELDGVDFGAIDTARWAFFPEPTPGLPNPQGYPGVVPAPVLSHPSGAYRSSFSVTAASAEAGAVLRYTTDGRDPDVSSPVYSAPITISATQILKVRAFKDGLLPSPVVDGIYIFLEAGVATFTSDLPVVVAETFRVGIGTAVYTSVAAFVVDLDPADERAAITDAPSWIGYAGLQLRGSSSLGFPKKMYKFEIRDARGDDLDVPLLGLPAESDWVLNGPYSDKSLMRNHLAYAWSNEIGRYATRTRFVELFLNPDGGRISSADYAGVYVLIEKIKRGDDRVDIEELLPSEDSGLDLSGGYILKKDRLDPGDVGFTTSRGQTLAFVDPKEEEVTPVQRAWITTYLNQFETALYGASFRDPVSGYRKYIDEDSFIDHHILVEITKNIDGFRLSTFMYKDRGKRLHMGPIWDYNLSLGNADYLQGWLPEGWYYTQLGDGDYPWYRRLFQDPDFAQRYTDRWTALRREQFSTGRLLGSVDAAATILSEAQARNFSRWNILGSYVWPNWFIARTWQEELDFMKGWIDARVAWIDGVYPTAPRATPSGGALPPGGTDVHLSAPAGTVYYTLDGTDPRLPGGGISPAALSFGDAAELHLISDGGPVGVRFLVPQSGTLGQTWIVPEMVDASWSGGTGGSGVGYEASTGFEGYIDWDVRTHMYGVNTTIYIRYSFDVADPQGVAALTLRAMYDDGFVAYLNGVRVAEAYAPATLSWDSGATAVHDDAQAVVFQDFDISGNVDLLRLGKNVLAVQALNAGASSSDFLFRPQLLGIRSVDFEPIRVDGPTEIVGRTRRVSSWSGVTRAVFVTDADVPLRVTEIMYRPPPPEPGSPFSADDFEFVELVNAGPRPVDLLGVRLTVGIEFDFSRSPRRVLAPGEYIVVVKDLEAFSSRYDAASIDVAGPYAGKLSNSGEMLRLEDGRGVVIQEFAYLDAWIPQTDGAGYSLHIVDPSAPPESWSLPESWGSSAEVGGSPGGPDSPWFPGGWQLPGDYNQDGVADIADAIAVLLHLFVGSGAPPPCGGEDAEGSIALLDANGDGRVDMADPVRLLGFLFLGGPPHVLGTGCIRITGCPDVCAQ